MTRTIAFLLLAFASVSQSQALVFRDQLVPRWLPDEHRFWYQIQTGADTHEFVLIDARTGGRKTAADLLPLGVPAPEPLTSSRTKLKPRPTQRNGVSSGIRLVNQLDFELNLIWSDYAGKRVPFGKIPPRGERSQQTYDGHVWLVTRPDGTDFAAIEAGPVMSTWILDGEGQKPVPKTTPQPRPTERSGAPSGIRLINQLDFEFDLIWSDYAGKRAPYGKIPPLGQFVQHTYDGHVWLVTHPDGTDFAVIEAGPVMSTWILDDEGLKPAPPTTPVPETSPDGTWTTQVAHDHIVLRQMSDGSERRLRAGIPANATYRDTVSWSPDSKAFLISAAVEVPARIVTIVESSPSDQKQPKVISLDYPKPGDPLPKPQLVLFRPGSEAGQVIDPTLFPTPYSDHVIPVTWAPDGSEAYFDYNERGHQCYRILAVNAASGAVRVVVEETAKTFVDYGQKTWRHWLHERGEILWMSERSGWAHLYLHDIASGKLKNAVTSGAWPVRQVLRVDAKKRQVWFLASGLRKGEDPYHLHLCRVNLDGSGFVQLTQGDGNHHIEFSPNGEWFIARWSRADHPPVHELRRSADGSLVCELERANASALLASGWTMPERFVAKGRDGKTDIHGVLIKPSFFDPAKSYPVVEEIYVGPHGASAPKDFSRQERILEIADEGFIIVSVDGMGTGHRGKAFNDVIWKNLKDAGFPDRIAWIRAAAKTRPWMDLHRVGIYGGSAGGQNAMRAVLDHPDFYKVAVADCGCHDNRMDKMWWNEQWMGWPVDESYARSSNVDDAHKLGGKLLLIVGEIDDNVDPASTTQVVAALQRAGKEFEYLPIMGVGHGAAETPYGSKARLEFLKKHLKP
jgi:dipeptidyl aminopeptidase/acylaminoacyl peptidase